MIIGHRHRSGIKAIGFNNIGTCHKVFPMNIFYYFRTSKTQQIIIPFQLPGNILKTFSTEICFRKIILLYHRTHGSIEHQDTLPYQLLYRLCLHSFRAPYLI